MFKVKIKIVVKTIRTFFPESRLQANPSSRRTLSQVEVAVHGQYVFGPRPHPGDPLKGPIRLLPLKGPCYPLEGPVALLD